jgi:threonine/homoserine/homoserine lactone efflux protein
MPAATLVAFALVAIPLILVPGPSVLFVIGRSLSLGKLGGFLSVVGNTLGSIVTVIAVAFGVGLIIAQSIVLFTIIKIAGAGYLIYLGVQAIRHRRAKADAAVADVARMPVWRILLEGFVVGATNPKSIVFFIAVLPQFLDYSAGNIPLQLLTLGAVFEIIAFVSDAAWALAAGVARDWFAKSPRRISSLTATGGVIMIGLGVGSLFLGHTLAAAKG